MNTENEDNINLFIEEHLSHYSDLISDMNEIRIIQPLHGVSNTTRLIRSLDNKYVLRIYENHKDLDKVLYEQDVLDQLRKSKLPFKIPEIIPTIVGESYVRLSNHKIGCLFKYIEGEKTSQNHIEEIGKAVAYLDSVLGKITCKIKTPMPPYYDIFNRHPMITKDVLYSFISNPIFPINNQDKEFIHNFIDHLERKEDGYKNLPSQIIHGDLTVIGNILLDPSSVKVTGIIDFESTSPDLRAMEIAVSLTSLMKWTDSKSEANFKRMGKFLSGYGSVQKLTVSEIEAIPTLTNLRTLYLFIYYLGRYLTEIDSITSGTTWMNRVENQFKRIRIWYDWLEANKQRLLYTCRRYLI